MGISASLEAQEAQVQKLRAQGQQETDKFNAQAQMSDAQRIQSIQLNDAQRIQNVQLSEGKRMQETDAVAEQFMFNTQENRTNEMETLVENSGQKLKPFSTSLSFGIILL